MVYSSQQQFAQLQKTQQMHQLQQMQREQSDMDMNGHRPQSPASTENAPSPSKRPRLEGGHLNGQQLAPNGRPQGQGMPGQPNQHQLLMQNGISPRGMNPSQFQAFQQGNPAAQQKSIQVYAQNLALHHTGSALNHQGIPNGLMNHGVMPNQTDLVAMPDGQGLYPISSGDYYATNAQVRAGMQTPGNGQQGTHALQDYQMQLMLLEQQNKRRLMMARREQDSMARADGQPPMPGQQLAPGTSPQGSRAGASPNPNDQMKGNTPKLHQAGLPGSPSAGDAMGQNRGSPASMNFNGGPLGPDMTGTFFTANGMRPPSSNPTFPANQMGQPGPGNRMVNGTWQPPQGQPMGAQQSPVNQPHAGTPQERGAMPPPQAPPVGAGAKPSSPQAGSAAPPTPQPSNKPGPKKKGETKEGRKVRINEIPLNRSLLNMILATLKEGCRSGRSECEREPGGDTLVGSGASTHADAVDTDYTAASELVQQERGTCDDQRTSAADVGAGASTPCAAAARPDTATTQRLQHPRCKYQSKEGGFG